MLTVYMYIHKQYRVLEAFDCQYSNFVHMDLQHSPPDSGGDHGVSKSHCCRLENVSYLRVQARVIAGATKVSTVTFRLRILGESAIGVGELPGNEDGKPLSEHNVLVCGYSQLTSTIIKPFILFVNTRFFKCFTILLQLLSPVIVNSEPEDSHSQQERVLISTRISDPYG